MPNPTAGTDEAVACLSYGRASCGIECNEGTVLRQPDSDDNRNSDRDAQHRKAQLPRMFREVARKCFEDQCRHTESQGPLINSRTVGSQ